MRPNALVILLAALLALSATLATPAAAAPIPGLPEESARLPFTLSLQGANGRSEVLAPVPEGANPVRLTGVIKSNYNYPGTVTIDVAGRRGAVVDATTGGPVDIALEPSDVLDGTIAIVMYVRLTSEEDCFADDNATATLTDARLVYQYQPDPATTIGTFLSPGIAQYTVVVAPDATAGAQSAALNAVAALTYRYPDPTEVELLVTNDPPAATFQERVVVIEESPSAAATANTLTVAGGALTIAGGEQGLNSAAIALGSDSIALIDQATVSDVSADAQFTVRSDQVSLAELGIATWQTEGIGRNTADVSINQPAFGQELESLTIELVGSLTPVADGGQGRVDLLWNGQLLNSVEMAEATALKRTLTIPPNLLRRDNTLSLEMSFIPPGGKCFPRGIEGRVDIDTENSTVTPVTGTSVAPGFERFPQVLAPDAPVALGTSGDPADALSQAGLLVAAVQSAGSQQYTFQAVDTEAMAAASTAGLLVGGDPNTAATFKAPLQESTLTSLGEPDPVFAAALSAPFASLQAYADGDRDLVLLADFGDQPTAPTLATALAAYANESPQRWTKLEHQVVVMGGDEKAVASTFAQPVEPDKSRTLLIATLVGFGLVALIVLLWLWRRPRGPAHPAPGTAGS